MTIFVRAVFVAALALFAARTAAAQAAPDPAAAEKQYRLAQRLGADRSPDAVAAFEKVVSLAPDGPYADDALVDLARLHGAPDWPEDLGALDAARAALARAPLEKVVNAHAEGDRTPEARYRLALLRCAPLPGRDPARGRDELIALAGSPSRDRWPLAARYVLGVIDEQAGAGDRAAGAFARIVLERPDSDVAPRAQAGFGRSLLAAGRFGDAASWFQEALEAGVSAGVQAAAGRELALREVLRERVAARRWAAVAAPLPAIATAKGASLLAVAGDGRFIVFDRKNDALQAFDGKGVGAATWSVSDVTALATDPYGRVFAAAKDKLLRLDGPGPVNVLALGTFASPAAIAVDAAGTVWLADRKGDRIARWTAGAPTPVVVRESKGSGVVALVSGRGRVIAAEEKTGRLVAITAAGTESPFSAVTFRHPIALAIDAAGRISVLDEKAETLSRLSASGDLSDTLALSDAGVSHPSALAAAPSGAVFVLDAGSGAVAVVP